MLSARFDIETFARNGELLAQLAPASDLFTVIRRRLDLPMSCVALVWGETGSRLLIHHGNSIDSGGVVEVLFAKTMPVELSYKIDNILSADGFAFTATASLAVQIVADRTELAAFRQRVLGSRDRADVTKLRRYCEEAVQSVLAAFAQARPAAKLSEPTTWDEFNTALREHFKPLGFDSGLALTAPARATFASPVFQRTRKADEAAELRLRRLESESRLKTEALQNQRAHLEQLAPMLDKLQGMAAQNDRSGIAGVVQTLDPAVRGDVYHGLFSSNSRLQRTEAVLVVAGEELLWFDPRQPARPVRRVTLRGAAGGLRSVRVVDLQPSKSAALNAVSSEGIRDETRSESHAILVGAGRGVHWIDGDRGLRETFVFVEPAVVRGGVNAAALLDEFLYATHSEAGLLRWRISTNASNDGSASPLPACSEDPARQERFVEACLVAILQGAKAVRNIQVDTERRLWMSVDHRVIGWSPDEAEPAVNLTAPDVVTTLVARECEILAGLASGQVVRWPDGDWDGTQTVRGPGGGAVGSLAWCDGGGVPRILIGGGRRCLELRVLGDTFSTEYHAEQPIRWGWAASDWIVGVNEGRDVLMFWHPEQPAHPAATVSIGRICGHSVQDVAVLPVRGGQFPA